MRTWEPGRSLLGFLTVKTAQEAQRPGQVTNIMGVAGSAAGMVGGDMVGALVQSFLPMFAPEFARRGIDIMKPYELEYGLSADDVREAQAVQRAQLGPAMTHIGEQVYRTADGISSVLGQYTDSKLPGFLANALKNNVPPQVVGTVIATLARADPEFARNVQTFMPGTVLDWSPLVQAVSRRNHGHFNAEDYTNLQSWFERTHKAGHFRNIPAQTALEALPYASTVLGTDMTPDKVVNLARMGAEIQGRGMAADFSSAMEVASSLGDPTKTLGNIDAAMHQVDQLHSYMKETGTNPAQVQSLVQQAREQGLPVSAMLQAQGAGAVAARQATGGRQTTATRAIERGGMQAAANFGNATSMKALTALRMASPQWDANIKRMIAKGDSAGIRRATDQAMGSPALFPIIRELQAVDTAETLNLLGQNPSMLANASLDDARRQARLLNDKGLEYLVNNPAKLQEYREKGGLPGLRLKPQSVSLLLPGGSSGGQFLGVVLGAHKTLADNPAGTRGRYTPPAYKPTKPLDPLLPWTQTKPTTGVSQDMAKPEPFGGRPTHAPTHITEGATPPAVAPATPPKSPTFKLPPGMAGWQVAGQPSTTASAPDVVAPVGH